MVDMGRITVHYSWYHTISSRYGKDHSSLFMEPNYKWYKDARMHFCGPIKPFTKLLDRLLLENEYFRISKTNETGRLGIYY